MHKLGITLTNSTDSWPITHNFVGQSIDLIIRKCTRPHTIKAKTNKMNLYAIEQITNFNHTSPIFWQHIAHTTDITPRRPTPKWFIQLTEILKNSINDTYQIFSITYPTLIHTLYQPTISLNKPRLPLTTTTL